MIYSESATPGVNTVGGTPNSTFINKIAGTRRGNESFMFVKDPKTGNVEKHTLPNARDLIRFLGWKQVGAATIINDHPDKVKERMDAEAAAGIQVPMADEVPADVVHEAPVDPNAAVMEDLNSLRAAYEAATGEKPHPALGKKKLQAGIDAGKK